MMGKDGGKEGNANSRIAKWTKSYAIGTWSIFFAVFLYTAFTLLLWLATISSVIVLKEQTYIDIAPNAVPVLGLELSPSDEAMINLLENEIEGKNNDLNDKSINKKSLEDKETLTPEERNDLDKLDKEIEKLDKSIEDLRTQIENIKAAEKEFKITVINTKDQPSLSVRGYIRKKYDDGKFEYASGDNSVDVFGRETGENEGSIINFSNAYWTKYKGQEKIYFEILDDWPNVYSKDIVNSKPFKEFSDETSLLSSVMIIYTDVQGTVYIANRNFDRKEGEIVYGGSTTWERIEVKDNKANILSEFSKVFE